MELIIATSLGFWLFLYLLGRDECRNYVNRRYPNNQEENYIKVWNTYTRAMSTLHSIIIISVSFYIIYLFKDNPYELLNLEFPNKHPNEIIYIEYTNIFMLFYLLVDCLFLISEDTESNKISTLIHHLVGIAGMFCFINWNNMVYNSLYYSLTELTTIFLNMSWFMIKAKYNKGRFTLFLFGFNTIILWVMWLIIRLGGSILLFNQLYVDYFKILNLSPVPIFMIVVGNTTVSLLNIYWFFKLTYKIYETLITSLFSSTEKNKDE